MPVTCAHRDGTASTDDSTPGGESSPTCQADTWQASDFLDRMAGQCPEVRTARPAQDARPGLCVPASARARGAAAADPPGDRLLPGLATARVSPLRPASAASRGHRAESPPGHPRRPTWARDGRRKGRGGRQEGERGEQRSGAEDRKLPKAARRQSASRSKNIGDLRPSVRNR